MLNRLIHLVLFLYIFLFFISTRSFAYSSASKTVLTFIEADINWLLDNTMTSIWTGLDHVRYAYSDHVAGRSQSGYAPAHMIIGPDADESPYIGYMRREAIYAMKAKDGVYPGGHLCLRFKSKNDPAPTSMSAFQNDDYTLDSNDFPYRFGEVKIAIIPVFGHSGGFYQKSKVEGKDVLVGRWDQLLTGYEVLTNYDEVVKNVAGHGRGTDADLVRSHSIGLSGVRSILARSSYHSLFRNARFLDTDRINEICPEPK